ncbi:MAG: NAD-dependent epimerase/dehydratase family protein, partial [Candidatus Nitrotoga sp.]
PPNRFIYISTSGVYGDCGGALVDETRAINPKSARAQRRVAAENKIRNWAKHNGVHASILRVPGIYATDRLPVQRIQQGMPVIMATEDSYSNHIHADDLARCIVAAVRHAKPNRAYNTNDDSALQMGEYFDLVADAYHLPRPPRVSRVAAQHMLSPMMLSFLNESRRLENTRMKRELKVQLRYATVKEALQSFNGIQSNTTP